MKTKPIMVVAGIACAALLTRLAKPVGEYIADQAVAKYLQPSSNE